MGWMNALVMDRDVCKSYPSEQRIPALHSHTYPTGNSKKYLWTLNNVSCLKLGVILAFTLCQHLCIYVSI